VLADKSRKRITGVLADFYLHILRTHPADLLPAVYLTTNTLAPSYLGVEQGVGPSAVAAAVRSPASCF
jgi:DNA ligase-1